MRQQKCNPLLLKERVGLVMFAILRDFAACDSQGWFRGARNVKPQRLTNF